MRSGIRSLPQWRRIAISAALSGALSAGSAAPLAAQESTAYRVGPGDQLEVNVFRAPDLTWQATVDIDGQIAYPPLGRLNGAGETIAGIEAMISDGLRAERILEGAEVTVSLTEARPVYVAGNVAQPGAFPYRSGLTIRRAIALAGGIDITRMSDSSDPISQGAEIEAEARALETDLASLDLSLARLAAELDTLAAAGPEGVPEADWAAPDSAFPELARNEERILADRLAAITAERDLLDETIALLDDLETQIESELVVEAALLSEQQEDLDRMNDMMVDGLTTNLRVQDLRSQFEDTRRRIADLQRRATETKERLAGLRDDRSRIFERRMSEITEERRDQVGQRDLLLARLAGLDRRLALLPNAQRAISVKLIRTEEGETVATEAALDSQLQPDDTIEIEVIGLIPAVDR